MTAVQVLLAVATVLFAAVAAWELARRRFDAAGPDPLDLDRAVQSALAPLVADLAARSHDERDASVRAALQQVALMNREQLGSAADQVSADLAAKKDVIGTRLDEVRSEMRGELHRLSQLVTELGTSSAQRFGEVDQSLRSHAEVAGHCHRHVRRHLGALRGRQRQPHRRHHRPRRGRHPHGDHRVG